MSITTARDGTPRWGLFGGTFDPVHLGHLALAQTAMTQLQLDQVRWLPVGRPWQKLAPRAADHHRVAMLKLAVGAETRQVIDERELHREGPTYTIDTLDSLAREFGEVQWHLIIGQDQLARLTTWHRWLDLLPRVHLAVVARDGQQPRMDAALTAAKARMTVIAMPPLAIASTDIRRRVQDTQTIEAWVPDAVARYIERHGLYR